MIVHRKKIKIIAYNVRDVNTFRWNTNIRDVNVLYTVQ